MNREMIRLEAIRKAEAGQLDLDADEKEIHDSFERGEWQSVANLDAEFERHREYARATLRKDRRINIRISGRDLEAIQKRAIEDGIPYQTLISSILHKYISGRLVEKSAF